MKIRTVGAPIFTFILGGFIVAGLFLECVIPNVNSSLSPDVAFIDLGESQGHYNYAVELKNAKKRYDYAEILSDYQLAKTYLSSPLYFYKRAQGQEMLKQLAENNYTQAAVSLALFHKGKMNDYLEKGAQVKAKEHSRKFYKWAKLASKQGDNSALLEFVKNNALNLPQEALEEDLKTLDTWAEASAWSTPVWEMYDYYKNLGEKEKAAKFDALFSERLQNQAQEAACTTITPWRGL